MNIENCFLADILEHPDEDGPRLIFADWLEENAQPGDRRAERAELIRLQIGRAHGPAGGGACLLEGGSAGPIARISSAHGEPPRPEDERIKALALALFGAGKRFWRSCRIERGFPAVLNVSLPCLAAHITWLDQHPIRHLHLTKVHGRAGDLAKLSLPARLTSLTLGEMRPNDYWILNREPCLDKLLGNLSTLSLHSPGTQELITLLSARELPRVTALQFDGRPDLPPGKGLTLHVRSCRNRHGGAMLQRLVALPVMDTLLSLRLEGCRIGEMGVRALAYSSRLNSLEELDLTDCSLDPSALVRLADAPWLNRLRSLSLAQSSGSYRPRPAPREGMIGWLDRLGFTNPPDPPVQVEAALLALAERLVGGRIERLDLRRPLSAATVERLRQVLGDRLITDS